MSFTDNEYDLPQLVGKTSASLVTVPTLRSKLRRNDPDGISSVPYYTGITSKKLTIEYTDAALDVQEVDLTIGGTSYQSLITDINSLDASNIQALDQDGFLTIRNKNGGKTHYIKILPQSVTADEGAALVGLAVDPFPGSVSNAGEVATAPGSRTQANPQGTALVAYDESLTSEVINRPLLAILRATERLRADLERDILVPVDAGTVTPVAEHEITAVPGFYLSTSGLRIPIKGIDLAAPTEGPLDPWFELVDPDTNETIITSSFKKLQVVNGYYADATTALNLVGGTFAAWGTKNGGTIYRDTVPDKVKHATTSITSLAGNVIKCAGATFETKLIHKNDPVLISGATNLTPFDHNGWFAVLDVIDEEHIAVRPLGTNEDAPHAANKPSALNTTGSGFGSVTVYMGNFVPCAGIFFQLSEEYTSQVKVRMMVGQPRRFDVTNNPGTYRGNQSLLGTALSEHVAGSDYQHEATAINGFTATQVWRDTTTVTGATLRAVIEDLIRDLAENGASDAGSQRIGASAVSIGGSTPNTLSLGTVNSQIIGLLTAIRDHINDTTDAHAASAIGYAGGGAWADSTTNPATTVELQLDKIISDLTNTAGAARVGAAAATDLAAGTIRSQLDLLAVNWGKLARSNTWTDLQIFEGSALDEFTWGVDTGPDEGDATPKALFYVTVDEDAGIKARFYATKQGGLIITVNAFVDEVNAGVIQYSRDADAWTSGGTDPEALKVTIGAGIFKVEYFESTVDGIWDDTEWTTLFTITGDGFEASKLHFSEEETIVIPAAAALDVSGVHFRNTINGQLSFVNNVGKIIFPITGIPVGAIISSWEVAMLKDSGSTETLTVEMFETGLTGDPVSVAGPITDSSNSPSPALLFTMGSTADITVGSNKSYVIQVGAEATNDEDTVIFASVSWKKPLP